MEGMAIDADENVYVGERWNCSVQVFTMTGTFLRTVGSCGSGDGKISIPIALAIDAANNLYVADEGNHRMQAFTSAGGFAAKWGSWGYETGQFRYLGGGGGGHRGQCLCRRPVE